METHDNKSCSCLNCKFERLQEEFDNLKKVVKEELRKEVKKMPKLSKSKVVFALSFFVLILSISMIIVVLCYGEANGFTYKKVKSKTKIRYKCFENNIRVPCPENFKESPEFIEYKRKKKARLHDTSRQYYTDEDREDTTERTYYNDADRTYYDETIRDEVND